MIDVARRRKALAVKLFVLQKNDRIGVADRRLEQTLGVGGAIGRDDLQAGNMGEPGGKSCVCWAPTRERAPLGPRKTIGQLSAPPDI